MFERGPDSLDRHQVRQVFMSIGKPLTRRAPRLRLTRTALLLILLGLLVLVALAGLAGAAERGEQGLAAAGGLAGLGERGEKGPRGAEASKIPPLEKLKNFSATDHASLTNFLENFWASHPRPLPAPTTTLSPKLPASTYNDLDAFAAHHPKSHDTALKLMAAITLLIWIGLVVDLRARRPQ